MAQLRLELLSPQPVAVYGAHYNCAVLINYANALTVRRPLHPTHGAFVSVIYHLLKPHAFVQHPDDDKTILV